MAIVYRHRRLDTNKVFYIGIGRFEKRAYDFNKRSDWWKKIKAKTDISVEIISDNIDFEDAKDLEVLLIKEYGRANMGTGILINMTDGGDGVLGRIISESHKQKLREANALRVDEIVANFLKHSKGREVSEETRLKISNANKGKIRSDEYKERVRIKSTGNKYSLGYKHTDESKLKMSISNKNKIFSKETRGKISISKSKIIIDLNTGVFYHSVNEVCELYGYNYYNLASQLNGKLKNKTQFKYI